MIALDYAGGKQALILLALEHVQELLGEEAKVLAGIYHARKAATGRYVRWGQQPGSVYLADQKLPLRVPRARHYQRDQEIPLEACQALQKPRGQDEEHSAGPSPGFPVGPAATVPRPCRKPLV